MTRLEAPGLGTLLRRLVEQLDGDVEAIYREQNLDCRSRFTPVIRHLEREGPSTLRDIAASSRVSHSAISQTVSEMLKKQLVTSSQGHDGRERVIALSAKGESILPRLHILWDAIWASAEEISREVGTSLPNVIDKSLAVLEDTSFRDRISRRLESQARVPPREN